MRAVAGLPYVVAGVKDLQLAVSAAYVREITRTPPWNEVPNVPRYLRGVINLRGKVLPLLDLRLRMDLPSALEEVEQMIAMLVAREQDHILWLKELLGAVTEGHPFTLARDPTECAFGKWYYGYKAEDIGFASVMYRFEMPHRRIHTIADTVLKYAERGEHAKAEELIQRTEKGDLRTVVNLFAEARTAFRESHKEVAIVLTDGRKHLAVTVDSVASVEAIAEDTIEDAAKAMGGVKSDLIRKVAQRANGKGVVFLLDAEALLAGHSRLPPAPESKP
ncbi:MAG: chemotaxis protein CheW [Verrucomicrobia bacterium]|nr:chemotaxis protein CheW [Verrucomicrobiota bacterium]